MRHRTLTSLHARCVVRSLHGAAGSTRHVSRPAQAAANFGPHPRTAPPPPTPLGRAAGRRLPAPRADPRRRRRRVAGAVVALHAAGALQHGRQAGAERKLPVAGAGGGSCGGSLHGRERRMGGHEATCQGAGRWACVCARVGGYGNWSLNGLAQRGGPASYWRSPGAYL